MLTNEELMAINGYSEDDLEHYGILGMKWGIRRYENPDGSLTEAGKRRYAKYERKKQRVMQSGDAKKILKFRKNLTDEEFDTAMARVAKTDALRYNANAAKREKQEARAAEKAERKAEKIAKEEAKLSKKEMANAKKIAEQNAKQSVKSRDFMTTLAKAAAITGTVLTLYKNVSGIAGAFGIDISPGKLLGKGNGKKEQQPQPKQDVPKPQPQPKPEPKPQPQPKPEPKPEPKPKQEYRPVISPVNEIKLSDLYNRTNIMPGLSTSIMTTNDIAKGRDRTSSFLNIRMDDISTSLAGKTLEPYKKEKRHADWL